MARRRQTQEAYDAALAAYREKPGVHANAARAAKVEFRTAKRMWEEGWAQVPGAIAIRERLQRDAEEARAEVARQGMLKREQADAMREQARRDAVESHAAEGAMVRLARSDATGLLASVGKLQPALQALAAQLTESVVNGERMGRTEAARMLSALSRVTKEALAAAQIAVELERLHLGAPTQIVGVSDVSGMTSAEAAREIEQAAAALARARKLGLLEDVTTIDVTPSA